MSTIATLICPKCRGEMHSYERNGVLIDQCEGCRGIFLDRGELERLWIAESAQRDEGDRDRGDERRWEALARRPSRQASAPAGLIP
jgi:Zn-finger nucleic acid-binding protein